MGAAAAFAVGPAPAASAAPAETVVIRVRSVLTGQSSKDVAPKNRFTKGDQVTMTDSLANLVPQFGKPKGAIVGADLARITFVREGVVRVVGIATFPDGTVRFEGVLSSSTSAARVVGGTGRYAGATGTITVRDLPKQGEAVNVYTIRLVAKASAA